MKHLFATTACGLFLAFPALACDGLRIHDAYARVSSPVAQSGAAFMELSNPSEQECRIVAARSDIAQRTELHTHIEDDQGVMRMIEVEEGFGVPANGTHHLDRGGDHIMFMGLNGTLSHGDEVLLTLVFQDGTELDVTVPVDLERVADHGSHDPETDMPDADHGHTHGTGHTHGSGHGH